jgi:hypothetical protein
VTLPVAVVAVLPVADTEADNFTGVPARALLGGVIVNDVMVGFAGGGGNGIAPANERESSLLLPEKRESSSVCAGLQAVIAGPATGGIEKFFAPNVTAPEE